jgi:hypothetical protein
MPRTPVVAVGLVATAVAGGCLGGGSPYGRYQHRADELRRIDALVASIPRYPGAVLTWRQNSATDYKVTRERYVQAKPYGSMFYYDVAAGSGALERWFRHVLARRRFHCRVGERGAKGAVWLWCRRGPQVVNVFIGNQDHYELDVRADDRRAPIPTVPGD